MEQSTGSTAATKRPNQRALNLCQPSGVEDSGEDLTGSITEINTRAPSASPGTRPR
ncbi:MAG: hypothetical protein R2693_11640 [Nocardioidaceae bacterium]